MLKEGIPQMVYMKACGGDILTFIYRVYCTIGCYYIYQQVSGLDLIPIAIILVYISGD